MSAPVLVLRVKEQPREGKDSIFWIETDDGQSYSTFDASAAKELTSFAGTAHKVRISFVDKKVGSKSYRNFVGVAIADDAAGPAKAAEPVQTASTQGELTEHDIPFGGK